MTKENIFGFIKIFPLTLFAGLGTMGIFLSWSVGLVSSMIIGFTLLSKLWKYSPMLTFDPIIKNMTRFSAGNYVSGIFYALPRLILPIMIINLISAESAGYFFIASTMAGLLYGISQSISSSFLAESYDKDKFWNNVNKAIKFNIQY
jgi:O-antigen/teichoic acid export membrane protein